MLLTLLIITACCCASLSLLVVDITFCLEVNSQHGTCEVVMHNQNHHTTSGDRRVGMFRPVMMVDVASNSKESGRPIIEFGKLRRRLKRGKGKEEASSSRRREIRAGQHEDEGCNRGSQRWRFRGRFEESLRDSLQDRRSDNSE
ncbi:hypothetical protein LXA43DRAFT_1063382 [Ganoderma leucocontextum]|nr:hypothetical protein LXA43DRAFT_1063382 [Ganoderma leucocontextum]